MGRNNNSAWAVEGMLREGVFREVEASRGEGSHTRS